MGYTNNQGLDLVCRLSLLPSDMKTIQIQGCKANENIELKIGRGKTTCKLSVDMTLSCLSPLFIFLFPFVISSLYYSLMKMDWFAFFFSLTCLCSWPRFSNKWTHCCLSDNSVSLRKIQKDLPISTSCTWHCAVMKDKGGSW